MQRQLVQIDQTPTLGNGYFISSHKRPEIRILIRTSRSYVSKFNRNRGNFQMEIGIPQVYTYTFKSWRTDSYPGSGAPYRRESWNCSIKQPFYSQISLVTRVYLVMAVFRLTAFPRNFRLVTSVSRPYRISIEPGSSIIRNINYTIYKLIVC